MGPSEKRAAQLHNWVQVKVFPITTTRGWGTKSKRLGRILEEQGIGRVKSRGVVKSRRQQ